MTMTPHQTTRDEVVGDPNRHLKVRLTNFAIDAFLIAFGLGFDGNGNNRGRKRDRLQQNRGFFRADGIARSDVLQTYAGADVTGVDFMDFFTLVGVHLQKTTDALALALGNVQHAVTRLEVT